MTHVPHTPNEPEAEKASVQRPRGPRWATLAASLWAAFQVAACDSPTEPDPGDDPDRIQIEAIEGLEPGEVAEVTGRNLDSIHALTLDGESVTFEALSKTRGQFTVPRTRDCEVDGRSVQLVANDSISHASRMDIADVLELEVAESRALSQEEFSCLKLGRGAEHYVLSVADFRTEPGHDRSPYELLVRGSGERTATQEMMGGGGRATDPAAFQLEPHVHDEEAFSASEPQHDFPPGVGPSEGPFDDYANAQPGDTVQMVDWDGDWLHAQSKEEVPSYEAIVVGVEGRQLILVDTRDERAMQVLDNPEARETISQAARTVDEVIEPTLKTLFGPHFEIMDGAGGRMTTILRDLGSSMGRTVRNDASVKNARWSSGMFTIQVHASLADQPPERANAKARVMNHEFGHIADGARGLEGRGYPGSGPGFYREAIAVATEDVAARLARGSLSGAPSPGAEGSLGSRIEESPLDLAGEYSPWGDATGSRHLGWYTRGAQILRYAQSAMGPGERWRLQENLLQRELDLYEAGKGDREDRLEVYGVESIAEEVGMTARELLQESMVADLTDGLVPEEDAETQGLPQIEGWRRQERDNVGEWIEDANVPQVDRLREATTLETRIPAGGYAFRYIPENPKRGVSLEVEVSDEASDAHEVRITRLR